MPVCQLVVHNAHETEVNRNNAIVPFNRNNAIVPFSQPPRRGETNPPYGLCLGGSELDGDYLLIGKRYYRYSGNRRREKVQCNSYDISAGHAVVSLFDNYDKFTFAKLIVQHNLRADEHDLLINEDRDEIDVSLAFRFKC